MRTMNQQISELTRLLENLICFARVVEADYDAARLKVEISGRQTAWLPWLTERAGADRTWAPPEIGEQVLILSPSGDPANGVICGSLYSNDAPAPAASADITRHAFADGLVIEHDRAKQITRINALDSGGTLVLEAENIIIRTGENGYLQTDNHGYVDRLTHKGGANFETETWKQGAVVIGQPDNGYSPPEVVSPAEAGGE